MPRERGELASFGQGVWLASEPVGIVGMALTTTMTVLRLGDGSLLLHSPISLGPDIQAAVEELGPVRHLYAPNTFHHMHIGDWATAFPEATLHAPAGLARKRPDLRITRTHESSPHPAFAGCLDEVAIKGFRLEESVLMYRPAEVLVVADLVHNVGRPDQLWAGFYTRAMGFYDRVAMSRMIRWTGFSDRRAASQAVDQLSRLPFNRVIVGHGQPIVENAKETLAAGLKWLEPRHPRSRLPESHRRFKKDPRAALNGI